ncbi:MAG: hypothetical protein AB8G96_17370 [Phycisphaerales bacterium]
MLDPIRRRRRLLAAARPWATTAPRPWGRSSGATRIAPLAMLIGLVLSAGISGGCASRPIDDPLAELQSAGTLPNRRLEAIRLLPVDGAGEAERAALARLVSESGHGPDIREAAVLRLADIDRPAALAVIRRTLPNMEAWRGLERLCQVVAREGWVESTPALVSSWARPIPGQDITDETRPEALALAALHGDDRVVDVVFETLMVENGAGAAGLRGRCWELLHRLGRRDDLFALVADATPNDRDSMMLDLQAGVDDLGILPRNREEILWLRRLREPKRRSFWTEASSAVQQLPAARRAALELRDVPVVVSVVRHRPELLNRSDAEIRRDLDARLDERGRRVRDDQTRDRPMDTLADHPSMTWGDFAAATLALEAMAVPAVREHLFDYAERDRADRGTEYGGVLALDRQGRFSLLEFPPRLRRDDRRFVATQDMLDAAYTALFHFHYHAQEYANGAYAGPGFGDRRYADAVRANCLVFTFTSPRTMNVDWYRHGRVGLDLGTIDRPGG